MFTGRNTPYVENFHGLLTAVLRLAPREGRFLFVTLHSDHLCFIIRRNAKNGNVFLRRLHVCLALSSSPASRRIPSLRARARARSLERANKPARARARGGVPPPQFGVCDVSQTPRAPRESETCGANAPDPEATVTLQQATCLSAFLLSDFPRIPSQCSHTSAFFQRRHTFWFITGVFAIP
ncbi:hypothetical protein QQF64_004432 [Cirrhinus molitorella]|uniref:Uncharacterized protein n=1 Tax=Cirrhinus molitorella TaxID=172907 RepID=A0ABR3MG67_9TELE